jgi:hypothetical protein
MGKSFKPETDTCPVCDTPWTKTNFGASTWYDCTPCGKKAEDIVVVKEESSSGTREYKLSELEEWERFIEAFNFDDDDYNGTTFTATKEVRLKLQNGSVIELPEGWEVDYEKINS